MADLGVTDRVTARTYAPSWLDRLTDLFARVPGPYWLIYLVFGIALALARTVIAWNDGSYPVGTLFAVHIIDGLIPAYFLFAMHLLDDLAKRAIADFRPRLKGGETEYDELTHRLTTMPFRTSLVVGGVHRESFAWRSRGNGVAGPATN